MKRLLEVESLRVAYGGHQALHGVSLHVGEGETVAILGSNGAGKSTLMGAVAGLLRGAPGASIRFDGAPIDALSPDLIVERGIALVPEGRRIFGALSVWDNLRLGGFARRARSREAETLDWVLQLFPVLKERRGQLARTMSGGEQQMLAIARALMAGPRLLLLDEPSLGLSPLFCRQLFATLVEISRSSISVLLVEQNARRSLEIADRAYLLENGRIVGEGDAEALRHDETVARTYLGLTGTASPAV